MSNTPEAGGFIFDTTCLNYFALTDNTHLLEHRYRGHAYVSRHVIEELGAGVGDHPELSAFVSARWFEILRLDEPDDLAEFINLRERLGKEDRNLGESATIVLAERFKLVAVIDEAAGRNVALSRGLHITGIVGISARMVRDGQVTEAGAWQIHRDMVTVNPNGFRSPLSTRQEFHRLCRGIIN